MAEDSSGKIIIDDIDHLTLVRLIRFIYIATLSKDLLISYPDSTYQVDSLLRLAKASDKYQMPALTRACTSQISNALSCSCVCKVLAEANEMGFQSLKRACLHFATQDE